MRRLVFNPLAQQPYASGEYDPAGKYFFLDKQLKNGLYLCVMQVEEKDSEIQTHISTLYFNPNGLPINYIRSFFTSNGYYKMHIVDDGESMRLVVRNMDDSILDTSYVYTIYLYKVI